MNWSEQEQIGAYLVVCAHFENDLSLSWYYLYFTLASKNSSLYTKLLKKSNKHILNIKATLFIDVISKMDSIEQKASLW